MTDNASRDLLIAWSLLPFLSPNRVRLLLEYFDPLAGAANASPALLEGLLKVSRAQAEAIRNARLDAKYERVVTLLDDAYPSALREIPDPPLALHYAGDLSLLARPSIAVVGSRRATPYGVNAAAQFARELAGAGLVVVSGMARGIDAAAHHAALDAKGTTIAVLGTGIDVVYPRGNARLFRRIAEHGLIVSEFAPGTPPKPENFPMRNRVISGLTLGSVIVEATRRSGSLITARLAAEQNREVFAVPGSIFSAGSEGTHRLVQYGAKLVHDVDDILDELPGEFHRTLQLEEEEPDSPLREVLAALTRDEGVHVDTLAERAGGNVAEALLQLELGGWVRALPGARYVRIR
ncbi:MAG TPA: DNA-processing protein DprA [Thermoanaerobaculia bacterium]|nr:DNA-processing protein DprA [Thermoanaerobaculia bacterium]